MSSDESWNELEAEAGSSYTSNHSSSTPLVPSVGTIDPSKIAPMLGLYGLQMSGQGTPDYLFPEQTNRSTFEKMTLNCGSLYFVGLLSGSAFGIVEGLRSPNAINPKLRLNAVLNAVGKRGTSFGNSLGVIALFYTGLESGLASFRQKKDVYNEITAAALTGIIYKSSRGVKAATAAGIVGGGVLGILGGLRSYVSGRGGSFANIAARFQ